MVDKKRPLILAEPVPERDQRIRMLLDGDTIVLLKSMARYIHWKSRYPDARLLDPLPDGFNEAELVVEAPVQGSPEGAPGEAP